jgi:hypothetical protein
VRPGVYACVAYIRRFRPIEGLRIPAVFGSVLLGLLHGCCTHCALDISAAGIYGPLATASI